MVFGLDNIRAILEAIGNPQRALNVVHIGGTNGKGSVAAMLSQVFMEGGWRVGKYTSPHLVSFTERITVDEEEISENEVVELAIFIKESLKRSGINPSFTFFDFTTAMAFEYFSRMKTHMAIIEAGLGGRLDSTNVVEPLVSIITTVSLDHVDYLGETVREIAWEKAGIIKDGVPLVTAAPEESLEIIEEVCLERGSPLYVLGRDFFYEKTGDRTMTYKGLGQRLDDVFVNLHGDHQLANSAIALMTAEILATRGFPGRVEDMRRGLGRVSWPGRIDIVRENPLVILDGAHNPEGIEALSAYIEGRYKSKRKILVFGVMKDKDHKSMLGRIAPIMDEVILTRSSIERALEPELMKGSVKYPSIAGTVREALITAREISSDYDLIVVTGSFYTIGEAKQIINEIF